MKHEKQSPHQHDQGTGGDTVKDPVCGMNLNAGSAAGTIEHNGHTYYFCSAHCQEKFRADPSKFAAV